MAQVVVHPCRHEPEDRTSANGSSPPRSRDSYDSRRASWWHRPDARHSGSRDHPVVTAVPSPTPPIRIDQSHVTHVAVATLARLGVALVPARAAPMA